MFEYKISHYIISNFKAIGAPTRFDLRPITLVFGPNSAGKSSLLHSLLLLKHIVEGGTPDVHRTSTGGEVVDLGGRHQYAHLGQVEKETSWRFPFDNVIMQSHFTGRRARKDHIEAAVYVKGAGASNTTQAHAPATPTAEATSPLVRGITLSDSDGEILRYEDGNLTLAPHHFTKQIADEAFKFISRR